MPIDEDSTLRYRRAGAVTGTARLYENNAGGLYLVKPYGTWRGFTGLESVPGAEFTADAEALLLGHVHDWTVPRVSRAAIHDGLTLVAEYASGEITLYMVRMGLAANEYLAGEIERAQTVASAGEAD